MSKILRKRLIFTLFCLLFALGAFAADTVRLQTVNQVPTIFVNGKPVRSRIFFGGPTSNRPIAIEEHWQRFEFTFKALADSKNCGTLHFRPERRAGTLWIDDIELTDIASEKTLFSADFEGDSPLSDWLSWPPKKTNDTNKSSVFEMSVAPDNGEDGSAALLLSLTPPADSKWPDAHAYRVPNLALFEGKTYRLTFRARSPEKLALSFAFYRPGSPFVFLGNRDGGDLYTEQIQMAADAGVNMVSFPIGTPWPESGEVTDWTSVDTACNTVLAANPNALLIPRIGVDPPGWWLQKYPGDTIAWDANPTPTRKVAAVSSERYRNDAQMRLAAVVRHIEEKYGPHVAGYHPCGQNTGEWFYEDSWRDCYSGYAKSDETAWRKWLAARYKSDAALQTAWGDDSVTLETAAVPSASERREAKKGLFLDFERGKSGQKLFDFAEFAQQMMAETVQAFARTAREASNGNRLVFFFYGYTFEFGALPNGPAIAGHYALKNTLKSPDIDIFCSPISYFDRGKYGSAPAMSAAESVEAAGKMWLFEDDTRTFLTAETTFPGWRDGSETLEGTRNLLRRNTAQCALRQFGTWWMDLGMSGWFHDAELWEEMKSLQRLDEYFLENSAPFTPEIAAWIDEKSMLTVPNNQIVQSSVYTVRRPLGRCGAPYGQYLLDDFFAEKTGAKLNVFLNPWLLDASKRSKLTQRTADSVSLWLFGSGTLDPMRGFSPENVSELTGFAAEWLDDAGEPLRVTEAGRAFGLTENGWENEKNPPVGKRFVFTDAQAEETLAIYADGKPAIVMRKTAQGGTRLAVGRPGLSPDLVRAAAHRAEVHLYTNDDCNVCANGPFVVLHDAGHGPVTVDFRSDSEIRDVITGEIVGRGPTLTLDLSDGQTRVFEIIAP